jgi:hypothetical protein
MPRALSKYRLGLAVIAIFTLGLLIVVMAQASATKQDNTTDTQANKAADKISNYTDNYGTIPASLKTAGADKLSPNISYRKLSATKYQFCVKYKAASSGFDTTSVEQSLVTAAMGQGTGGGGGYNYTSGDNTYLSVPTTHHKGQNCQTITPYLYNSSPDPNPVYTPSTPSTPPVVTTPSPALPNKEELTKPPTRRPVQYIHVCTDAANITYVSQGSPQCLSGGTFQFDYDQSVAGTYYSVPCQTTSSTSLRYVYVSASEACPSGTAAVN